MTTVHHLMVGGVVVQQFAVVAAVAWWVTATTYPLRVSLPVYGAEQEQGQLYPSQGHNTSGIHEPSQSAAAGLPQVPLPGAATQMPLIKQPSSASQPPELPLPSEQQVAETQDGPCQVPEAALKRSQSSRLSLKQRILGRAWSGLQPAASAEAALPQAEPQAGPGSEGGADVGDSHQPGEPPASPQLAPANQQQGNLGSCADSGTAGPVQERKPGQLQHAHSTSGLPSLEHQDAWLPNAAAEEPGSGSLPQAGLMSALQQRLEQAVSGSATSSQLLFAAASSVEDDGEQLVDSADSFLQPSTSRGHQSGALLVGLWSL